ncbi:hypothetical protein, partial [Spongiibacter tropicus]|uniref:hypothetical protein n=1 Tax=Spongiibacter tropicus TaxID=454602 RepID=UPI003A9A1B2B
TPRFTLFVLVFGFGKGKLAHAVVRLKWVFAGLSQILEVVQTFLMFISAQCYHSLFNRVKKVINQRYGPSL